MFKQIVLVLALACLALAQRPRCEAPAAFEARIVEVDPSKQWEVRGALSYDAYNRRTAVVEEVVIGQQKPAYYHFINLYDQNRYYKIDLSTKDCTYAPLNRPFRPFEIPQNSTNYGSIIIGSQAFANTGLSVDTWAGYTSDGDHWVGTFTTNLCIPVSDAVNSAKYGFIHTSFYDVVLGIPEPEVFTPPTNCHQ